MTDKPYKIKVVQKRDPWTGKFGTFDSFALQLEGFDGWVEKSQKQETPDPQVGDEIFGHIETTTRGENTYYKFKSASKGGGFGGGSNAQTEKDLQYIIMMLEELTLRRESPDNPTPRDDNLPSDDEASKPFDLSEIPF